MIISQVVLSFGIPFALIPLVRFTSDRTRMGADVNHRLTTAPASLVTAITSVLNVAPIYLTVTGKWSGKSLSTSGIYRYSWPDTQSGTRADEGSIARR